MASFITESATGDPKTLCPRSPRHRRFLLSVSPSFRLLNTADSTYTHKRSDVVHLNRPIAKGVPNIFGDDVPFSIVSKTSVKARLWLSSCAFDKKHVTFVRSGFPHELARLDGYETKRNNLEL